MNWKKNLAVFGLAMAASTFAAVSYTPVTEGATESAQKLYNFLAVNYGAKTISGMMTGDVNASTVKDLVDIDSMYQVTGHYPALVGFDFLFATGKNANDSWYQQYTSYSIDAAKDLWNQGGIPAFTWHWKDPSDQFDAFYTSQSSAGEGNEFTTYDFTQGFTDPSCTSNCTWNISSEVYNQVVSDIDEIADYFLDLQQAGVAAIFRPIHEASGAWFWWGLRGGAAFQALYKLIYDEMVNVKGVKNLVWVWNPEYASDTDWNPGSTYYDVISLDIYEAWDYTTKYTSAFQTLTKNFATENKILAISENGPIPDASAMHDAGTVWSWWMPWYQSWSGKFLNQTVESVWKANMDDDCTITLENMPGWANYTISSTPVEACTPSYKLGELDSSRVINDNTPEDLETNRWLRVYSTAGAGDTAKGNVIIKQGNLDFATAGTTLTLDVFNGSDQTGFWFTIAFLGGESNDWGWAQPDGCWINAGETKTCTIDMTTLTKDKVVLTGDAYTAFMSDVFKVYIEIFASDYAGSMYFDNVQIGDKLIENFETTTTFKAEQDENIGVIEVVGNGKGPSSISQNTKIASAANLRMQGNSLMLTTAAGNVSVDVFGMNGKRVATLFRGAISAGTHAFDMSEMPKGQFIVRVRGTSLNAAQIVKIK